MKTVKINEKDNAFSARLKSLISIGVIPEDIKKQFVDFTPIDSAAKSIVLLLGIDEPQLIYHLYNNKKVQIQEIVNVLNRCNIKMRFGSDEEVKKAIYDEVEGSNENKIDGIIVDITKNAELKYVTDVEVTNDISIKILNKHGFDWPKITGSYLDAVIGRIIKF